MTVRILTEANGDWYPACTGSIVAPDLVLTAAHCFDSREASRVRIAFGAQPLSYSQQLDPELRVDVLKKFSTRAVEQYVEHPLYGNSDYDHDMALVKIQGTIPAGYLPVPLLADEQMKDISSQKTYQVLLAGFGLLAELPRQESLVLRQTEVSAIFEGSHLITDQTKGSGGCNGDSGGPAYLKVSGGLVLVGVTHGPTLDHQDCRHRGVWGNPNLEKTFLRSAAERMGSAARF